MAIDLVLVAILVKAGGGAFLGIVAAFVLFRASASNQRTGFVRQSVRLTLRLMGALVLFLVVVNGWSSVRERTGNLLGVDEDSPAPVVSAPDFPEAASDASAQIDLAAEEPLRKYLAASEANDTTALQLYRDSVREVVAGNELAALERSVARLEARNTVLEREIADARKARGIRSFLAGAAEDLGVGFGWSAVYFTAFLALWRGQTPGKRFAKVRVLRLDGKPMGWWMSAERFGGYAASLSLGLLGFVQILWDRNRQGIHDKVCETVVVVDSLQARSRS